MHTNAPFIVIDFFADVSFAESLPFSELSEQLDYAECSA